MGEDALRGARLDAEFAELRRQRGDEAGAGAGLLRLLRQLQQALQPALRVADRLLQPLDDLRRPSTAAEMKMKTSAALRRPLMASP